MGIPEEKRIPKEEIDRVYERFCKDQFLLHLCFTLRVILGPVIESLILMDRYVYLREQGFQPYLFPVFDEHVSPRNIAIICRKWGHLGNKLNVTLLSLASKKLIEAYEDILEQHVRRWKREDGEGDRTKNLW